MLQRRKFIKSSLIGGIALSKIPLLGNASVGWLAEKELSYNVALSVPCKLFDGKSCWAHPRGGLISARATNRDITFVMAMLDLSGNDIFPAMYGFTTTDTGKTWTEPAKINSLSLSPVTIGGKEYYQGIGDFVPMLHRKTNTLLGTGHTLYYDKDWKAASPLPKRTAYSVYDEKKKEWKPWKTLNIPDELDYKGTGAGCTQRIDLPDGKILLPVSFKKTKGNSGVTVMLCSFNGDEMLYEKHGSEHVIDDTTRGVGEPSLAFDGSRYFLTVRHNERGYVTTSKDGLDFEPLKSWTFDDGSDLGSYNTQQHWVSHSDALFLVYTRRGANNDHVFRNRAPLFMAKVDKEKICVIRGTETVILPERGARYGNFGICTVDKNETWITESEWMQPKGCEKYGSDGKVYVAKITWNKPNKLVS